MADLERNKLDESKNIFVSKLKDFDVWQKLKPVQLNPKFRYIGCVMNEKKQNNFKGYETLDDVKNDMRHYNNYLQWINENERFLYFDIDKVLLNECEFISYIDRFIDCLNTHLSDNNYVRVKVADFQFHTKLSKCGRIKSIHIISNKYFMNFEEMESLVDKMEKTISQIDTCIYGKGRAFFNCFTGKCGSRQFYYHEINVVPYQLIWIDAPQLTESSVILRYKQPIDTSKELHTEDFIEYLIENRSVYLKKTINWIMLCRYVKRNNIMTRNTFCLKSLVGKYTYDQNIFAWDELDTHNAHGSLQKLCEKICKKTLITDAFNKEFLTGIEMDADTIKSLNETIGDISYTDKDGNIRSFNRKTGVLHYHDGTSSLAMGDQKLERENLQYKHIKVEDLPQYYHNSRVFIRALYGVGKTYHFITPVVQSVQESGGSILFITENNVLNAQFKKKFGLVSHIDKDYTDDFQVVTSLESFIKFKRTEYDLVVLDEFVSLMAQFKSSTMARVCHQEVINKFLKVVHDATQVIVTDADLSQNTYPTILNEIQPETERTILSVDTNNYDDYTYNFVFEEQQFNRLLDEDLKNNLRVSVAVTIRSIAEGIYNKYKDTKNIIFVSRDKTIIGDTELNEREVAQFKCGSMDKYFTENKIDLFVYSPTITTGLSIDDLYFDRQYGYSRAMEHAPPPRTFLQMLHRTRQIRDKNIVMFVPKPRITPTEYDIRYMESRYNLTSQRMKQNGYGYAVNKLICNIENETDAEKLYGEKNFTEALYILLRRHKLKVVLVPPQLFDDSEDISFACYTQIDRMINFIIHTISQLDVEADARDIAERLINNQYYDGMKFKIYSLMMDMRVDNITYKSVFRDKSGNLKERSVEKSYTFNGVYQASYFMGLLDTIKMETRPLSVLTFKPHVERIIHVKQIKTGWRIYDDRINRKQYYAKNINNNKDATMWMRETTKIDIREWMDSLANENNRITDFSVKFKISPELLENINSLRDGKKAKFLKIDNTFGIHSFINKIMKETYGYSYDRLGRNADEAVLMKLQYVTFGSNRPPPLDVRMGLNLTPNEVHIGNVYDVKDDKLVSKPVIRQIYPQYISHKTSSFKPITTTKYGFKISNKHNNTRRLSYLYDAMKQMCQRREYIINPSKGTLALFNDNRNMERYVPTLLCRKPDNYKQLTLLEIGYGTKYRVDKPPEEDQLVIYSLHG